MGEKGCMEEEMVGEDSYLVFVMVEARGNTPPLF